MEIRPASSVEEPALRAFYAEAFPERAEFLSAHWRWLYRVGEFPGIEPLVLVDGGRVRGHAGAIPVKIKRGGEPPRTAIWFVDFHVAHDLQGRGHGKALTEAWMKLCPDRVTFCNDRSIIVFRKFGWAEGGSAKVRSLPSPSWARPLLKAALAAAPEVEVLPLPDSAAVLTKILDDESAAPVHVVRDADFAKWRLLDHPLAEQHVRLRLGDVGAIARLFVSRGKKRAHLLHVAPGEAGRRGELVSGFLRWALDMGADACWLATNDPVLLQRTDLRMPRGWTPHYAWSPEAPGFEGLPTQGLDSDHDLMFPC